MIIEYMMTREGRGTTTPAWVEDGGYFQDMSNNTLVGWTPDLANRNYYVPDSVLVLTRETLTQRQLAMNAKSPQTMPDGSPVTDQMIIDTVNAWCDARGE